METLSEAVDRLTAAGYRDQFRADGEGLRSTVDGCVHEPEALIIDEVVRFEGPTDPGDEAVVFALRCPEHDTRGTYTAAFGAGMDAGDAEVMRRLALHARGAQ